MPTCDSRHCLVLTADATAGRSSLLHEFRFSWTTCSDGHKRFYLRQAVLLDVVSGRGGKGELLGVRRHRADGLFVVRQRRQRLALAQVPHLDRLVVAARDDLCMRVTKLRQLGKSVARRSTSAEIEAGNVDCNGAAVAPAPNAAAVGGAGHARGAGCAEHGEPDDSLQKGLEGYDLAPGGRRPV